MRRTLFAGHCSTSEHMRRCENCQEFVSFFATADKAQLFHDFGKDCHPAVVIFSKAFGMFSGLSGVLTDRLMAPVNLARTSRRRNLKLLKMRRWRKNFLKSLPLTLTRPGWLRLVAVPRHQTSNMRLALLHCWQGLHPTKVLAR